MHVISPRILREFWKRYPRAEQPLRDWLSHAKKARWASFHDIRADYNHVDSYGDLVIFDVGGNKYRMIVRPRYPRGRLYIIHMLTHAEYDRGEWK